MLNTVNMNHFILDDVIFVHKMNNENIQKIYKWYTWHKKSTEHK